MKFTKMNGVGNDFIIINNIEEEIKTEKLSYLAKTLCARRTSIGADGLMLVEKQKAGGDYKMIFYNADGTIGEMCGNGARCIARYGYEKNLAGEIQRVETTAGMVVGERINQREYRIKLNQITKLITDYPVAVENREYPCSYVELGNPGLPHAVVRIEGLKGINPESLRDLGRQLRYHPAFPKGANVNFYDILGEDEIVELTYERGVEDFTLACGTGAGSMAAVLTTMGEISGKYVKVHVPGGELFIEVKKKEDRIEELYLTGMTNIVAEGQIRDEELNGLC